MSRLSFKAFCIEAYAQHTGKSGPEVYARFSEAKLLELLDTDYEDLHGMGKEWLDMVVRCRSDAKYIHGYDIVIGKFANDNVGETVNFVQQGIMRREDAAMEAFYRSATGAAFADDKTGLYGQSPDFIFGLFREERDANMLNHF